MSVVKKTVFWDVELCSLVEVYRRFRGACCLHHQGALSGFGRWLLTWEAIHVVQSGIDANFTPGSPMFHCYILIIL
jgi:hypothetical protein